MRGLLVLGVLLLAGCSSTETGSPTPGETTTTTTSGSEQTTTTTKAAGRPEDLDISGVDVCQVLGVLPVADWGIAAGSQQGGESSLFPGSQDCYGQGDNIGLTLTAVKDRGAADYAEGAMAEVTETDVDGYALYVLKPGDPAACFGALDVHDGQMLFLNHGVNIPDQEPVTAQDTLCQRIPEIAKAALAALAG